MALFPRPVAPPRALAPTPPRPKPPARRAAPADLSGLLPLCPPNSAHPLPVRTAFDGKVIGHDNQVQYVYRCPFCGTRAGFVTHRHTGEPLRLWVR